MTNQASHTSWVGPLQAANRAFDERERLLLEDLAAARDALELQLQSNRELASSREALTEALAVKEAELLAAIDGSIARNADADRQILQLQGQLRDQASALDVALENGRRLLAESESNHARRLVEAVENAAREQSAVRDALQTTFRDSQAVVVQQAAENAARQRQLVDDLLREAGRQRGLADQLGQEHQQRLTAAMADLEFRLMREIERNGETARQLADVSQRLEQVLAGSERRGWFRIGAFSKRPDQPAVSAWQPPALAAPVQPNRTSSTQSRENPSADPSLQPSPSISMPSVPLSSAAIESVDDLLMLRDESFVHAAYLSLLGRKADPDGFSGYLRQLRQGVSKEVLLARLASSGEGRAFGAELKGLRELLDAHRLRASRRSLRGMLSRLRGTFLAPVLREMRNRETADCIEQRGAEARLASIEQSLQNFALRTDSRLEALHSSFGGGLNQIRDPSAKAAMGAPRARLFTVAGSGQARVGNRGRVVLNVTTSQHWRTRPVGIVRVERELAIYLAKFSNARFVAWDGHRKTFTMLTGSAVEQILDPTWCDPAFPVEPQSASGIDYQPEQSDTFVSIGLDWDHSPTRALARFFADVRCAVVLGCHDLVPIRFPEYCVREDFDQLFKGHFVDMAHTATAVFANSSHTAKDLQDFWRSADLETELPPIEVVQLANLPVPKKLPVLGEVDVDRLRHIHWLGKSVLYVSSFEARKNHRLLLNLWNELYEERGEACPALILVGMAGWGTKDLIDQMGRMTPYLRGKIIWLSDVQDDFLLHLYQACDFAVFPSHFEGWGLAASEALAFGKICLVASGSGLPEATQGLMPQIHPLDFPRWKAEVERLLDDPVYKRELESAIADRFVYRSWGKFAEEFFLRLAGQPERRAGAESRSLT